MSGCATMHIVKTRPFLTGALVQTCYLSLELSDVRHCCERSSCKSQNHRTGNNASPVNPYPLHRTSCSDERNAIEGYRSECAETHKFCRAGFIFSLIFSLSFKPSRRPITCRMHEEMLQRHFYVSSRRTSGCRHCCSTIIQFALDQSESIRYILKHAGLGKTGASQSLFEWRRQSHRKIEYEE